MPRALVFQFGDSNLPIQMQKIDRTRLYGSKEVEALDAEDHLCELATLADDGRTLVGKGCTALGWLDADGKWRNKSELKPHNVDGDLVEPVPSSFDAPIKLFDTVPAEEYLAHNIRLMYRMCLEDVEGEGKQAFQDLVKQLQAGTIFSFPYSYRGGLEADAAFLLMNEEEHVMMVVGNRTQSSFVGIQSSATEVTQEDAGGSQEGDLMDFDMI
ncbi:MAG: hypothetical protein AAF483_28500 [Planctomycetota bacterium]